MLAWLQYGLLAFLRKTNTNYLFLSPTGGAISGEWRPVLIWASIRCCCPSPQDRHDCIWHTGLRPNPQNQPLTPTAGVDQPASAGQRQERIWAHEWIQVWRENLFLRPYICVEWEMTFYLSLLDLIGFRHFVFLAAAAAINVDICHSTGHFFTTTNPHFLRLIFNILGPDQCGA